ncbi:GTPase ObgE [Leptolyngbya cf. ectocarpi LEGE 11479]|uniref:GTPase Obg n=1 Tax=Leptolyngbya cf. ectocarpi LEGE 11479 TaxID=1828722 RepID=A0A928ZT51_LEPEC|nr:GTPase ObgE [Leptolyngbya ectocarpi]MBE9066401.1 GTPase ObgE [Leptolyngbya cf. ectocarpi LEGE 11479]
MQFIDQAEVDVRGGNGGDGLVAFRREKYVPAGGPSGGRGGDGGSVILHAVSNLQTLLDFRYAHQFQAEHGQRGGPKNMTGAMGKDLVVEVPCGTIIYDAETGNLLGDLITEGQTLCVAEGGKGGLGNSAFLSNRNRAPETSLPGLPGAEGRIRLELKLLAEVGIIGLPNAGKSTLISALSAAKPKVADYPFTTLVPNLGVVRKPTGDGTVFADIPGLIAGAHEGAGLGHDFLRHIERTRVLLHVIDITTLDPIEHYQTIQQELVAYGHGLAERPQLLALNKVDAVPEDELEIVTEELMASSGCDRIFAISAVSRRGLDEMLQVIWDLLEATKPKEIVIEPEPFPNLVPQDMAPTQWT